MLALAPAEIVVISTAGCTVLASCVYFLSGEDVPDADEPVDETKPDSKFDSKSKSTTSRKVEKQNKICEKADEKAGKADKAIKAGWVTATVSGFAGVKPLVDVVTGDAPSWGLPILIGIGVLFLAGTLMIYFGKQAHAQATEEVQTQAEQIVLEEEMGLEYDDEDEALDDEPEIDLEPDGSNVEVEEIEIEDLPELGKAGEDDPKK